MAHSMHVHHVHSSVRGSLWTKPCMKTHYAKEPSHICAASKKAARIGKQQQTSQDTQLQADQSCMKVSEAETEATASGATDALRVVTPPSSTDAEPLPAVSRGRVFASCAQVSGIMLGAGLLLRAAAPSLAALLGSDADAVHRLLSGPQLDAQALGIMAASAAAITAARQALLAVWPEFAAATDRSNGQVLAPLEWYDILWVAGLPGVSEELLFRGGIIPAVSPDWRGVLLSGAVFGLLHNSGGRNLAFAAWASVVGVVYGAAYLATNNIAVPVGAHVLANIAAATLWLQLRQNKTPG